MTIQLQDRRVLVVGASGGIGAATARAFRDAGAQLTAAGRPSQRLEAIGEDVGGTTAQLDVLDNDAVEAFFSREAPFDHVVIAAATKTGPVAVLPLDDAKAAMESKFWGAYRIARAARVSDGGSITPVSGLLSRRPSARAGLQGAINAALEALSRGLALERAPIRVNTVSPGLIDTPLHARMAAPDREAFFARTSAALPAQRIGLPEDMAQAILFLATNPFATGTTVTIEGRGNIL